MKARTSHRHNLNSYAFTSSSQLYPSLSLLLQQPFRNLILFSFYLELLCSLPTFSLFPQSNRTRYLSFRKLFAPLMSWHHNSCIHRLRDQGLIVLHNQKTDPFALFKTLHRLTQRFMSSLMEVYQVGGAGHHRERLYSNAQCIFLLVY